MHTCRLEFGHSPQIGSEAVIGLPDDGTVLKYELTGKSTSLVVPMSDDKQTLIDTSITQEGGMTVMSFTKILDEDQYEIVVGPNTFILNFSKIKLYLYRKIFI